MTTPCHFRREEFEEFKRAVKNRLTEIETNFYNYKKEIDAKFAELGCQIETSQKGLTDEYLQKTDEMMASFTKQIAELKNVDDNRIKEFEIRLNRLHSKLETWEQATNDELVGLRTLIKGEKAERQKEREQEKEDKRKESQRVDEKFETFKNEIRSDLTFIKIALSQQNKPDQGESSGMESKKQRNPETKKNQGAQGTPENQAKQGAPVTQRAQGALQSREKPRAPGKER